MNLLYWNIGFGLLVYICGFLLTGSVVRTWRQDRAEAITAAIFWPIVWVVGSIWAITYAILVTVKDIFAKEAE